MHLSERCAWACPSVESMVALGAVLQMVSGVSFPLRVELDHGVKFRH